MVSVSIMHVLIVFGVLDIAMHCVQYSLCCVALKRFFFFFLRFISHPRRAVVIKRAANKVK